MMDWICCGYGLSSMAMAMVDGWSWMESGVHAVDVGRRRFLPGRFLLPISSRQSTSRSNADFFPPN
jgi:hypothetical protein